MLSKKYRFHGHGSLRFLFQRGATRRSRHLMVRFVPNPKRSAPRIAVVVSKKIFKSAVKRNRARRRIFEIVRGSITTMPQAYDIVITVFSAETITLPHDELERQVKELLAFRPSAPDSHRPVVV